VFYLISKKSLSSTSIIIATLFLLIFLTPSLIQAAEYTSDDFFPTLIENKASLTYGYGVFEFYNPTDSNLVLDSSSFYILVDDYVGNPTKKVELLMAQDVVISKNVTDYTTDCYNKTSENGTIEICERTVSGWHWENRTEER
jgi:predicted nicotinamide N-methyase